MANLQEKICTKCRMAKPLESFSKSTQTPDGLMFWCRPCRALAERARTPEWKCWKNMNARCSNPKHPDFPNYGGRGITVTSEWRGRGGFVNFLGHVGLKPSPKHQLDRKDNSGNYEPGNVRWVLPVVNMRNRRNTRRLTWNGETKTLAEWAEISGISIASIASRVRSGWSAGAAIFGKNYVS